LPAFFAGGKLYTHLPGDTPVYTRFGQTFSNGAEKFQPP